MAKKEEPEKPAEGDEKPASKSKLKLIIIIVVGLLLAIGISVGGTLFFFSKGDKHEGKEDSKEVAAAEDGGEGAAPKGKQLALYEQMVPAFITNYNLNGKQRYMQVTVALMARDEEQLKALKVHMPMLRNQLVMLFSSQNFESLMTPVGKEMLRQQATAKVQELAKKETGNLAVEQVLFTNFVLQ